MFICELCGNTVAHVNHADVCKSCASMTFKAVKQEVKKAVEDKNNQDFMLAYFGISLAQFEAVTHDNLSDIVDSKFVNFYKDDAKRVLWHDYRENAFTKKGDLRKVAEKQINDFIANIETAIEEIEIAQEIAVIEVAQEVKAEPKKVVRNEREQYAINKAAEHRATAKLLGASALTGSPKQKAWAEKIRKGFIEQTDSEAVLYEVLNNPRAQGSDFWIQLRDCDYMDIVKVLAGVLSYDRFKLQAAAVRNAKKAIDKHGRDVGSIQLRLSEIKTRYGVEL
ncbi:hypothetical protein [Psychrobacter sp. 16-MNA-CIBAN-0192]|uniref:hypothetical protein n=1 Tax=Psychrobacter sp. 16-MNA-CIBAN-0192 TaxID=3140448 RepID=UPI0033211294